MQPAVTHASAPPAPALFPRVKLTPGEIRVFRRRPRLSVSQWAEEHRYVTDGPWPGPWRNSQTPYLVEPMDTWGLPHVRSVVVVATPQSGKSQIIYNCWAYGVDVKQASSIIVMADEATAVAINEERLQKIIKASPSLRSLISDRAADITRTRLVLQGIVTQLAWATSVPKLATMPREHVFQDEVDKYPPWKGSREADPVALADARATAFRHTGKRLKVSTTTVESGYIWQELLRCQELRVYMARCPACGELQIMRREQLKWDAEVAGDPARVETEDLAWYECEHCRALWGEAERRQAVREGCYRPHRWDAERGWFKPADPATDPASVAFHFSAFYSPFVSLGEIAARAILAEHDPQAEHDLCNRYLGLPYREERVARQEDHILRLCDERVPGRPGIVPKDTVLIATVDVHESHHNYVIRAWRPGPELESWLVAAGEVPDRETLRALLDRAEFLDADGAPHPIAFGLMDSGWDTEGVYNFCLANPPIRPSKGFERMEALFRARQVESHPGLVRYSINTTHYKNALDRRLRISPGDPGAYHLHANSYQGPHGEQIDHALIDYARQLCAEAPDERGRWVQIRKRPNHYLDCEVLQLAAVDILKLRMHRPRGSRRPAERTPTPSRRRRW